MGHLKDISNQSKIQTFPSSTFEIAGDVPASQCSEAKIEGDSGFTAAGANFLSDIGAFTGFALAGKKITVSQPPPNAGTFNILFNDDNILTTDQNFAVTTPNNHYWIHNGGELIITRDLQSFANFISAAGYAYTIKGAKLYTNIPSIQLSSACTILFDPLT